MPWCTFAAVVLMTITATTVTLAQEDRAVTQWTVFELDLTAAEAAENPYVAYLQEGKPPRVQVEFTGTEGGARGRKIIVAGFWDGGKQWKARFAPPAAGTWQYVSRSEDAGLNATKGTLTSVAATDDQRRANPTLRGFVRVHSEGERAGRYFEYADGTPMLWVADTWWNWSNKRVSVDIWRQIVDDRAAKGFNIGQLFFAANGWGRDASLLDPAYDNPDLGGIQEIERRIAYANSKGITVWIHPWWSRQDLARTAGPERMRRWWRYVTHRLGAYNVIWTLAGEYNMWNYGGLGLDFWKDLGALVEKEDPYSRIIGAHPTPPGWDAGDGAPQWSTAEVLHNEPWLHYNQSQLGHGRWRNEMAPRVVAQAYAQRPAKPIVITEPWYEFAEGNASAADVRFAAWSAFLSGAAGHTYGGGYTWLGYVPNPDRPRRVDPNSWPLEPNAKNLALDYPGAVSMGTFARVLSGIEWWRLEPHPELLQDAASQFCAAVPGELYVIYLRWGGGAWLDLSGYQDARFAVSWTNLVTHVTQAPGELAGGRRLMVHAPQWYPKDRESSDWVLVLQRKR